GALLHDVGKIGVRDAVLLKPSALDEAEWVEMRRHPGLCHQILSDIPYLTGAAEIARTHHERWDGAGYPRGLRGEEIPLAGRICAVCDVYDALVSPRPYKDPWSQQDALAEIVALRGRHFDRELVEAFLLLWPRPPPPSLDAAPSSAAARP